jgi:hypothetical protein
MIERIQRCTICEYEDTSLLYVKCSCGEDGCDSCLDIFYCSDCDEPICDNCSTLGDDGGTYCINCIENANEEYIAMKREDAIDAHGDKDV